MTEIVRVKSAPGLKWRKLPSGAFEARWRCRDDLIARSDFGNFKIKSVKLWSGVGDPTKEEWDFISDTCSQLQNEMLVWAKGGLTSTPEFDGTISGLIHCYKTDPDSVYKKPGKLRYASRINYDALMSLVEREYGSEYISNLKGRILQRWYDGWSAEGKIAVAHAKMKMLRMLISFGTAILEDPECARMSAVLSKMKFEMAKPRTECLTAVHANLIRAKAHEMGRPSIALAQAFQFELMLRQKDVIGEWVPMSEPGMSDVVDTARGLKWLRGIRWEEIDQNLILVHVTSKRNKKIAVNLNNAPMVMEELAGLKKRPTQGPVVVYELHKAPYTAAQFRWVWREIANAAGVPKAVRNMDSRAGAITEASDAGAELEHIRHAATHSDIAMTQRYSRGAEEKIAQVQKLRILRRNKSGTEGA